MCRRDATRGLLPLHAHAVVRLQGRSRLLPHCSDTGLSPRRGACADLPPRPKRAPPALRHTPRWAQAFAGRERHAVTAIAARTVEAAAPHRVESVTASLQPAQRRGIARGDSRQRAAPRRGDLFGERNRGARAPQRPAAERSDADRTRGSPVVRAQYPPWPRPGRQQRRRERPGGRARRSGSVEAASPAPRVPERALTSAFSGCLRRPLPRRRRGLVSAGRAGPRAGVAAAGRRRGRAIARRGARRPCPRSWRRRGRRRGAATAGRASGPSRAGRG